MWNDILPSLPPYFGYLLQGPGVGAPPHSATMSAASRFCARPDMRVRATRGDVNGCPGYRLQLREKTAVALEEALKKRCSGPEPHQERMPCREASSYAARATRHAPDGPGDRASGQSGDAGHRNALRYEDSRNARSVMARIIQSMEAPSSRGPPPAHLRCRNRRCNQPRCSHGPHVPAPPRRVVAGKPHLRVGRLEDTTRQTPGGNGRPAHKDVRFRCWTVECVREDVLGRLGT